MRINPISTNYNSRVLLKDEPDTVKVPEIMSFSGKDLFVKKINASNLPIRTKKIMAGARKGFKDMSFVNHTLGGITVALIPITAALQGAVDWFVVCATACCFGFTSLLSIIGGISDAKKSIKKQDELKKQQNSKEV